MITKTDFVQRVIYKLMDYRRLFGVKIYFKHISPEYLVIGAVPKDECIYLQGLVQDVPCNFRSSHTILTFDSFIGMKYEEIMNLFILVTTIQSSEVNKKRQV